jgi:hypothetical protein
MDLKAYFEDLHNEEAKLKAKHPEGLVHVTSLFHREKNSTPGSTLGASCRNAARVITDGTHREATPEEVEGFLRHQQDQLRRNSLSEQVNKKQYFVVVDPKTEVEAAVSSEAGKLVAGKGKQASNRE